MLEQCWRTKFQLQLIIDNHFNGWPYQASSYEAVFFTIWLKLKLSNPIYCISSMFSVKRSKNCQCIFKEFNYSPRWKRTPKKCKKSPQTYCICITYKVMPLLKTSHFIMRKLFCDIKEQDWLFSFYCHISPVAKLYLKTIMIFPKRIFFAKKSILSLLLQVNLPSNNRIRTIIFNCRNCSFSAVTSLYSVE